jgi:hypothetical protein
MTTISNNQTDAIEQLLSIIRLKNIDYKHKGTRKGEDWYELFGGSLIIENYDIGRSKKGLLTTNNKNNDDIKLNDKLKWTEKFGRSNSRYKYNILGKPISDINRILDIANLSHQLKFALTKKYLILLKLF